MKVFRLIKEDLSSVGLAMGYQETSVIWEKFFAKRKDALKYAEADHGDSINWVKHGKRTYSGDLRSHDYIVIRESVS